MATGSGAGVIAAHPRESANETASSLPKPHPQLFTRVVHNHKISMPKFSIGNTKISTIMYHMKNLKFVDMEAYKVFMDEAKSNWADFVANTPKEAQGELIPKICRDLKSNVPEATETLKRITKIDGIIVTRDSGLGHEVSRFRSHFFINICRSLYVALQESKGNGSGLEHIRMPFRTTSTM